MCTVPQDRVQHETFDAVLLFFDHACDVRLWKRDGSGTSAAVYSWHRVGHLLKLLVLMLFLAPV